MPSYCDLQFFGFERKNKKLGCHLQWRSWLPLECKRSICGMFLWKRFFFFLFFFLIIDERFYWKQNWPKYTGDALWKKVSKGVLYFLRKIT